MSILKIHLLFKKVNKIFFSFAVFTVAENKKEHHSYEVLGNFCFKILFKTAVFPQAFLNTLTRVSTACRNLNCTSQSHRETTLPEIFTKYVFLPFPTNHLSQSLL